MRPSRIAVLSHFCPQRRSIGLHLLNVYISFCCLAVTLAGCIYSTSTSVSVVSHPPPPSISLFVGFFSLLLFAIFCLIVLPYYCCLLCSLYSIALCPSSDVAFVQGSFAGGGVSQVGWESHDRCIRGCGASLKAVSISKGQSS